MQIEWSPSSNFQAGRKGRKPIAIVNHITAGLMPGTLSWLKNPASKASSHYLVTKTGRIYQLVKDENTAWHAGGVNRPNWSIYDGTNPNYYTIGIEHECLSGGELTEPQYQATLWLHRQLMERWNIPVNKDHVIGHYQIDSINRANDPGAKFPWKRLYSDLKGGNNMPEWMNKIMLDAKEAGLITSDHNPMDPASKWFVLAVALNIIAKTGR